jgi:pyruvate dehydrogenase E2 component (dihydrolipoamide acetyltransferase)
MPAVRHKAQEAGVDLARVPATGAHGHVTIEDLEAFLEQPQPGGAAPFPGAIQFDLPTVDRTDAQIEPIKGLRKRIAENMTRAKTLQAHFTYVLEVRADKLVQVREEAKALAEEEGVKLTYLPFIAKAVVRALQRHPRCNALVDEEAQELVIKEPINLGIAAQTDKGLVVPVVHDADEKTLLEIAQDVTELAGKAQDQKLSLDDIQGGTFTITSLGRIGGLHATPVLAHPQVAIMGVHAIRDVPVVEDGEVVPGKVMNLSFTFDHRVIDGYDGALFANEVKRFLEDPNLLLLASR